MGDEDTTLLEGGAQPPPNPSFPWGVIVKAAIIAAAFAALSEMQKHMAKEASDATALTRTG